MSFKIPRGIRDGEKIRLASQGEAGINGGGKGDLYLRVRVRKEGSFEIEGNDLITNVDIYPWEAALGEDVTVKTIDGRILVKVPLGIQSDMKIRVENKGYVDKNEKRGDLYIKVRIVNPMEITPSIRELYEKLKNLSKRQAV